ncbi:ABC transporter substrate-binding protein [Litorivicinus lipolyticus]|uniref:ABC transporter substrate-binding protein n=1 Tax=Litorivicinus lipolyticus TaxID=418701 RepID=UPI003B5C2C9E
MSTRTSLAVAISAALVSSAAVAGGHLPFSKDDTRFSWDSLSKFESMDLSGQEIRFDGPWISGDEANLKNVLAYFEQATGAKVQYNGSNDFEQLVLVDMKAGNSPNLAAWPQPGTVSELAAQGELVALKDSVKNTVVGDYAAGQSWADLGTYAGANGEAAMYGLAYNVNLKSLVWYVPENFEEAGYDIPQSMEELIALTDQIVDDGGTPWCIGMESGGATGWVATDWIEDIMLRTQPKSVYDQWISNDIPFTDPRIVNAIETFGFFALNDDYVDGSASSLASVFFGDSPKGLFESPAKCYMHRQASFIPAFFPEEYQGDAVGTDVDFFYFPAYEGKDLGKPVLGGGTLVTMMNESEASHVLMDYLTSPIAHEIWMAGEGFLTPHSKANLAAYSSDVLRKQGEIFLNATTFGFDASDMMPGAIGAGAFWTGMVDYTNGKSAEDVAAEIQASWDAIK